MDGGAETQPEAPPEMACRKRARRGQFVYGDISLKMGTKHLLGSELLPRFQSAPAPDCELGRAAMGLQGVSAQDRGNLIERERIKGLPVSDRGENVFCH